MAGYTQQYTFGVRADTKDAQSALSALSKSLRDIQTKNINIKVQDNQIAEAAEAARILQHELTNAMNVNTGKLDLSKLQANLRQAGTSVSELGSKLLEAGSQGEEAFSRLAGTIAAVQAPTRQLSTALKTVGTTIMNTIKWQAASSLIHGLMSTISGAISYAKNLNSTLNDIRIVTGASTDDMARFATQANAAAKALSTSTNEFAKASLIYYQQGDSAALAAKKAEITTKAANVAFTASAQEMSQMLTAVWNSFQMGEDQLEHAVDVMAKLGANTASSMEEMAKAMQKVAATANTVGISMDQMSAIVATAASVTRQAPETIGTAWNTVLGRISNLKLGETLEDGVDLTKYTKALKSIGVDVLDATGELRNMGEVVDEIGAKWQTLDKAQKSALAATIGGVRQYTQINAFFENFDKYQKNLKQYTGSNASGALNEQQEIYAQSWEAASKRVKAAMEEMYSQMLNDQAITKLTSVLSQIVGFVNKIGSAMGGLPNMIGTIVTMIASAHIDTIATRISEGITNIKSLFSGGSQIQEYATQIGAIQEQMTDMMARTDLSDSSKIELEYDIQILEIKKQIAEQQGQLTKAQQENAQATLANLEADKQYYTQLAKLQEQNNEAKAKRAADQITNQVMMRRAEASQGNAWQDLTASQKNKAIKYEKNGLDEAFKGMELRVSSDKLRPTLDVVGEIADRLLGVNTTLEGLTTENLTDSLRASMNETKDLNNQIEQMGEKFNLVGKSAEDLKNITGKDFMSQFNGEPTQAVDFLKQQAQAMAKNSNIELSDAGTSALGRLDVAGVQNDANALKDIYADMLTAMQQASQDGRKETSLLIGALKQLGYSKDEIKELIKVFESIGSSSGKTVDEAEANLAKLKNAFEKNLSGASDKIRAFTAMATGLSQLVNVINQFSSAWDKFKDPDATAWEKIGAAVGVLVSTTMLLSTAMRILNTDFIKQKIVASSAAKSMFVKAGADTAEAAAAKTATAANTALQISLWPLLAIMAAVVVLFVAFKAASDAAAAKAQELKDEQEALATSMQEVSDKNAQLTKDLQTLQTVMADTTLTYQEQLDKINEICKAYGVQATMLDILSGNYDHLQDSMTNAAQSELRYERKTAQSNLYQSKNVAFKATQQQNQDTVFETGWKEVKSFVGNAADLLLIGSLISNLTGGSGSLATDWSNSDYESQTMFRNYNREGGKNGPQGSEKEAILKLADKIEALGFTVDRTTGKIDGALGKDGSALLQLISSDETLNGYTSKGKGSYLGGLSAELTGAGYDKVLENQQMLRTITLQERLFGKEGAKFDWLGLSGENADLSEVLALLQKTGAQDAAERTIVLDYLSGFSNYSEAGAQISAINTFADQAAKVKVDFNPQLDQEQVSNSIFKSLSNMVIKGEISAEALVKINPTDIVMDINGNWTINKQARELAEAQVRSEKALQKQSDLDTNKSLMTGKSFKRGDFQTLVDSGLFEDEAAVREFMTRSQGEREIIWQEMYDSAVSSEQEALTEVIEKADARIPVLTEQLEAWWDTLKEKAEGLKDKKLFTQSELQEMTGLEGEDLYRFLVTKRSDIQTEMDRDQELIDEFEGLDWDNASDDVKKKFAKKLKVDVKDVESTIASKRSANLSRQSQVDELDEVLTTGDQLSASIGSAEAAKARARASMEDLDYYEEYAAKVDKSATAVKAFTEALGKQGTVSNEVLGKLSALDEKALEYYETMSAADWNKYVYEQGIKEYDRLIAIYEEAGDEASVLATKQEKLAFSQQYWNTVAAAATKEAERVKTSYEEIRTAAESVQSTLSDLISQNNWTNITAKTLDGVAESLRKIGWEESKIIDLQDKLLNGDADSKEKIFATLEAETNAALEALISYSQEEAEYMALRDGQTLKVKANVEGFENEPVDMPTNANIEETTNPEPKPEMPVTADIQGTKSSAGLLGPGGELTLPALIEIRSSNESGEELPEELQAILDKYGAFAINGVVQWSQDLIDAGYMTAEGLLDFDKIEQDFGKEVRNMFETNFSQGGYFSIPAAVQFMNDNADEYFGDKDGDGQPDMDVKGYMEIMKMYGANINTDDPNNPWFNICANLLNILDPEGILEGKTIEVTPVLANTDAFETAYQLEMWRTVQDYYSAKLAELTSERDQLQTEIDEKKAAGEDTTDLELRLQVVEKGIETVSGKLESTNTKVSELETELTTLRQETLDKANKTQTQSYETEQQAQQAQQEADKIAADIPGEYARRAEQTGGPVESDWAERHQMDMQNEANQLHQDAENLQTEAETLYSEVDAMTEILGDTYEYDKPTAPPTPTPAPTPTPTPAPQEQKATSVTVEAATVQVTPAPSGSGTPKHSRDKVNTAYKAATVNNEALRTPLTVLAGQPEKLLGTIKAFAGAGDRKSVEALMTEVLRKLQTDLDNETRELYEMAYIAGKYAIQGLNEGMDPSLIAVDIAGIHGNIENKFQEATEEQSPSKLTKRIGNYLIEGLNLGVNEGEIKFSELNSKINQALKDGIPAQFDGLDTALLKYINDNYIAVTEDALTFDSNGQLDEASSKKVNDWVAQQFKEGKYLEMFGDNLSAVQTYAIEQAKQAADKAVGELTGENSDEWFSEFFRYFYDQIDEMESKIQSITTSLKESWRTAALNVYNNEVDTAQKVYDLWEKTFSAIAKVRTDVWTESSKSIMEEFYDDAETLDALIKTLMEDYGMTMQEALNYLSNPNLTSEDKNKLMFKPFESSSWADSGAQRYLPRKADGSVDLSMTNDQVIAAYNQNLDLDVDRIIQELFQGGKPFESYQNYINTLVQQAANGDAQSKAMLEALAAKGYAVFDETSQTYKALSDESAFQESKFFADVKGLIRSSMAKTDDEIIGYYTEAGRRTQASRYENAGNLQTAGETIVDNKQSDIDLLQKARQEMLKEDGDLSTALTLAEQERLLELTGASDLASVGLNDVENAAFAAAQALKTLAEDVPIAMGMIQRGEATNWSINSETGEVKVSGFSQAKYNDYVRSFEDEAFAAEEAAMEGLEGEEAYVAGQRAYQAYMDGVRAKADEMKANGEFDVDMTLSGEAVDPGDKIKNVGSAEQDVEISMIQDYADAVGYTKEEFVEYRDELLAASGETRKFTELSGLEKQQLLELTRQAASVQNAWSNLKKNVANWNKTMDTAVEGSKEWKDALKDMTKETKAFFGGSTKVTDTWVKNHRKDIEKAVEGDEAALERLQDDLIDLELGANKDYVIEIDGKTTKLNSVIDDFEDRFKDLQDGAVITPEIDTSGATGALVDLINQGGETAESIMAALNSIGWTPEIEMETVPISEEDKARGSVTVPVIKWINGIPTYGGTQDIPIDGAMAESGQVQIPKLGPGNTVQVKGLKKTGAGQSSGKTPSSSSGGGGGSAKKVEAPKKHSDEKERYHEITKKLDQQSKLLERVDKVKSRTFGANHLKAINDEIAALEKENKLYAEQAAEASANMDANRTILESYGATFNEDGTINYEEYMNKIIDDYNAAVQAYNDSAQNAADELALKEAEEIYAEAKKAMENYEEDMDKLNDAQSQMLENQNKISAAMLEGIQYKVEIQWDLNDRDVKYLQYLRDKWEDTLDKADESMQAMVDEAAKYEDNLVSLVQAQNELDQAFANGTLNEADYATGLQDINDKSIEMLNNLLTIKKSIKEAYGNTLQKANEELEKYTSILEHSHSVMEQYIELQQLMGLGADYSGLKKMYDLQVEASNQSVAAAKAYLDTLKASRAKIEEQIAEHGWTDTLKEQWNEVNTAIIEGEDDLLSKTNQALTDAQNKFINTMNAILDSFDETLFGMKGGLAKLEDDYAYYQEEQSRYLSTSKELYEVAKLNREIDQSVADSTTKTSKERLKALKEEINAKAEAGRLTEYDVQMMELQYKHALALQELEDAKNAKSVVRLTRDENGNFGYQYTADDKNISDAAQKVDDTLQQINELAANRVSEMEQAAVQAERQYRDSLLEIAQDTTLTLEERQAKMEELTRRYAETMQYNQEQYNNATSALLTNQQYVYERYGTSIMTNTGMIQDQMSNSVAAMMSKTGDYATFLQEQMAPGGQIYEALQTYKEDIDLVNTTSGLGGWAGMTASVDDFREANEEANAAIADTIDTLAETLENIADVTENWEDHADVLERVIADYEKLATTSADALRKLAAGVADVSVTGTPGSATEDAESEETQYMYMWGAEGFSGTWSGYDSEKAALKAAKSDIRSKIFSTLEAGETDEETAQKRATLEAIVEKADKTIKVSQYKHGGLIDYTGPAWVDGSLNDPELMLNSADTRNLLKAVNFIREIDMETLEGLYEAINESTLGMMYNMGNIQAAYGLAGAEELQQNVQITAEFPNATDRNEIAGAFEDIINLAAQYASRKK